MLKIGDRDRLSLPRNTCELLDRLLEDSLHHRTIDLFSIDNLDRKQIA